MLYGKSNAMLKYSNNPLRDIVLSAAFKKAIKEERISLGIPEDGFQNIDEWKKWIKNHKKEDFLKMFWELWRFSLDKAAQLGLTAQDAFWIEAHIVLNENYLLYKSVSTDMEQVRNFAGTPGECCAIEYDLSFEHVNLQIYPGATQRRVISFLKENWDSISGGFHIISAKKKPMRIRPVKGRDERIYNLHEQGHIDSYGRIKNSDAVPRSIARLDIDYRRKIITTQNKKRK